MPTTSNFGWTTPADTDLVKDGAAAIRTLGNGIDTSLVDLKGGTTGQVLSKNSNTDLDFTWVAQDDSNAIQNAIVDAKGDLITATAADTPARLASSAVNGDVLTVDTSTATGLKWATPSSGGMTLISTTTFSGASVTLSSIPSTYNSLRVVIRNYSSTVDGAYLAMRLNADSTANRHFQRFFNSTGLTASAANGFDTSAIYLNEETDNTVNQGLCVIDLPDYANTVTWKFGTSYTIGNDKTTTSDNRTSVKFFAYNQTSAISSLEFYFEFGTGNADNGTILLYGVK